jgi:RND family efflux transporter MFP subunit
MAGSRKSFGAILWILLAVILGGVIYWHTATPKLIAEVGVVKKGQATAAVYGTVLVEPVVQTIVRAQISGVMSTVKIKKGDVVKEGQTLAEIIDESANQALKAATSNMENEARKRSIGPPSKPALDTKRSQVKQLAKLVAEGNIARSEYDRNMSELKTLEDKVKNEQLALDAAVETAAQKLESATVQAQQGVVRSPQDGVVLEFYTQLGEVITARNQIFLIGSKECHIRAQINEEDVGSLKEGMPASVRLYSYPNRDFAATLREVLPQGGNQEYSVILTLNAPPERLLPGMTGEINIILGRHPDVIIIPSRAVRSTGSGASVFVVEQGVVRQQPVKIGLHSIEMSEIVEGLKEGEQVILSDQDLFKPGQRVKCRIRENK